MHNGLVPSRVEASVIIPTFNAAEFLEEQLLALARQRTDVQWELIIADNGSTDDTLAITESFVSRLPAPVRILDASARPGASAARNIGAAAAVGDLLLFADQDDVVDELWLQELVVALREHPFVGGRLEMLELNGAEVASWRDPVADEALPLLDGVPWAVSCNYGCTAAAFAAVGGFDEAVSGCEDQIFSLSMNALGFTAVYAERALVHYRYRREPLQAVRQMWRYARSRRLLIENHHVTPPSILDVLVVCYRAGKHMVRDLLDRRQPVRPAVDIAYNVGEASLVLRDPAFWWPVCRREKVENPLIVQRDRLGRVWRRLR